MVKCMNCKTVSARLFLKECILYSYCTECGRETRLERSSLYSRDINSKETEEPWPTGQQKEGL
jgi:hypothetical protein